eukprot:scaffold6759_cov107-Isochrysis_galbana.AAC.1
MAWRSSRALWLVLAGAAAVKPPGIRAPPRACVTRRSLLSAAPAACALAVMPSVPAARATSLTAELRQAEEALAASDGSTVLASINRLLELSSEYGGMPSDALRKELIEKVRRGRATWAPPRPLAAPAPPPHPRWHSHPACRCRTSALVPAAAAAAPGLHVPAEEACRHCAACSPLDAGVLFSFPLVLFIPHVLFVLPTSIPPQGTHAAAERRGWAGNTS